MCCLALWQALAENSADKAVGKALQGLADFMQHCGVDPCLTKRADRELR